MPDAITDEMVDAGARALFSADGWVALGERIRDEVRIDARRILSAALAGRQVVDAACDAIVPKAPPDDWTPTPCGAEMQWFGCCANGHDQRQTLPFDARDRIERVLRIQGVASGSVEGAAARIMRALTDTEAAGSGSGEG